MSMRIEVYAYVMHQTIGGITTITHYSLLMYCWKTPMHCRMLYHIEHTYIHTREELLYSHVCDHSFLLDLAKYYQQCTSVSSNNILCYHSIRNISQVDQRDPN